MLTPKYFDNGVPVYTRTMIDLFGLPQTHFNYLVIDDSIEYLHSYSTLETHCENLNNVHRYDRLARFSTMLLQIIGDAQITSQKGLKCIKQVSKQLPKDYDLQSLSTIYQLVRTVMRRNGLKIYYNRIATILHEFNITDVRRHYSTHLVNNVIQDFEKMHYAFTKISHKISRKYFPNLKYVALKLLLKYGFSNPFGLKLAKTPSRLQKLDMDFEYIWGRIEEEELITDLISVFD